MIISKEEYPQLKQFVLITWSEISRANTVLHLDLESVIREFESHSKSRARKGLALAINDLLEMTWDLPRETVDQLNAKLLPGPTLSQMRAKYSGRIWKIARRGRIRNEQEYYLVRSIADDHQLFPSDISPQFVYQILDSFMLTK